MFGMKLPINWVLKRIGGANDEEIMEIIKSLIYWQKRRYPDEKVIILSLPIQDKGMRLREIDRMCDFLKGYTPD